MDIYTQESLAKSIRLKIQQEVTSHSSLEQVINWGLSQNPPKVFADTIQQDEFTIDVIIPYDDNLYLVYDVT